MTAFPIHPQLLADCHLLGRRPVTRLLLHRNAAVPWRILVPETDLDNLLDLPPAQREAVLADCKRVAEMGWVFQKSRGDIGIEPRSQAQCSLGGVRNMFGAPSRDDTLT